MCKSIALGTVVAVVLLSGGVAWGDMTAILTDLANGSEVWVQPGASFNVLIKIDTPESLVSGQLAIEASVSDIFTLQSVTFDGVVWSDSVGDVLPETWQLPDVLSPRSVDIGTLSVDAVNGTGTGEMTFVLLGFSIAPSVLAGSTYTLGFAPDDNQGQGGPRFGNLSFGEVPVTLGSPYTVHVIPAPGAVVLGVLGLAPMARLRRRLG